MKTLILIFCIVIGSSACYTNQNDMTEDVNKTGYSDFQKNCMLEVTHEQLKEQSAITLKIPRECDSVRVYFPPGGTITHAGLYNDSTLKHLISETTSFGLEVSVTEESNNFLTVSKEVKGKYYLIYGSCHWGSRMWIEIE